MEEYKLISFVDLDGTLLSDSKEISERNRKALKTFKDKGHLFVPCSGRYSSFILKKISDLDVSEYIISDNGALVYNYLTKEKIYASSLDKDKLKLLLDFADEHKIGVVLNSFEKRFRNIHCNNTSIENIISLEDFKNFGDDIYQAVFITKNYDLALSLEEEINKHPEYKINYKSLNLLVKTSSLKEFVFDINNQEVSKGRGVKELLDYLNISKDNAIAIGDHYNDITMFNEVGIRVAMANAYGILREKADLITDTNEDDGVAKILMAILKTIEKKS